ncbi:MAG: MarR family transcriptional regulator, partial [Xanthobacteraceae bacterium]
MAKDDGRLTDMPGHLIRRLQQIAFALFLDQAKAFDFTPVQYA